MEIADRLDRHESLPSDRPDDATGEYAVAWLRIVPFLLLHAGCVAVFWVGWSPAALLVAAVTFWLREFGLTAFYHRYFSHRAFKTTRWFQFVGACLGNAAVQRGPLWWAAHHREHHRHSDERGDVHSPHQHGFLWSHMGWFLTDRNYKTDYCQVKDFLRYPELVWLNRFDMIGPVMLGCGTFALGYGLQRMWPELGTNGWQMFVWAFLVSTVALYHVTYAINSLAHVWGTRRYDTDDQSRNNFWLALAAAGEGWHNNHHRFPGSARQGFFWWEVDTTYYLLWLLACCGIVWDLRPVPEAVLHEGRTSGSEAK